ncbi:hypothetical protein ACQY0O_005557 [Thecaphora frezii]
MRPILLLTLFSSATLSLCAGCTSRIPPGTVAISPSDSGLSVCFQPVPPAHPELTSNDAAEHTRPWAIYLIANRTEPVIYTSLEQPECAAADIKANQRHKAFLDAVKLRGNASKPEYEFWLGRRQRRFPLTWECT